MNKPRNRATETSLPRGHAWHALTRLSPCCVIGSPVTAWQGETRQPLPGATSNRHAQALCPTGGSLEHAGRWLECGSNVATRGMIARQVYLAYKIRPTDLSHLFFFGDSPALTVKVVNKCKRAGAVSAYLLIKDMQIHLQFLDLTTYFFPENLAKPR